MKPQGFSSILHEISAMSEERSAVSIEEILKTTGPKGHPFLSLFLALPFIQPIPLPGFSVPFGLAIGLVGIFMALDRPPWLPVRLTKRELGPATVQKICGTLERFAIWIEKWIRPRGRAAFRRAHLNRWIGIMLAVLGGFLSLPLPIPASNAIPAWTIAVLAIAALEEDAALLMFGVIGFLMNLAFFAALIILPLSGARSILS